jgi:tetratricopeptide (TPR) repeat protein
MKAIKSIFFVLLIMDGLLFACQQKKTSMRNEGKTDQTDTLKDRLTEITSLIQRDSGNAGLFNERAALYIEKENYTEALKDALTSVEIDSTRSDFYVPLADAYLGLGKLQSSLQSLDKAIVLDPGNKTAVIKLAEINIIFRDYKKAMNYIDEVIKLDELDPKAYFLRGVVFLENKDTSRSIRNFQKAIDVDQDYFDAHLQLGMIYAGKKNKLAIDYFNNALNIKPDDVDVSYYLAMYYQETGVYDEAIKIYEGLLLKDPEFYYALYNIGYINLVYLKDYPKAVEYFTKVIEQKPDYTDAWYNRGFAWEMQKNVENSQQDYKKALEITPNYEKAIDGLNRIDDYLSKQVNKSI